MSSSYHVAARQFPFGKEIKAHRRSPSLPANVLALPREGPGEPSHFPRVLHGALTSLLILSALTYAGHQVLRIIPIVILVAVGQLGLDMLVGRLHRSSRYQLSDAELEAQLKLGNLAQAQENFATHSQAPDELGHRTDAGPRRRAMASGGRTEAGERPAETRTGKRSDRPHIFDPFELPSR